MSLLLILLSVASLVFYLMLANAMRSLNQSNEQNDWQTYD